VKTIFPICENLSGGSSFSLHPKPEKMKHEILTTAFILSTTAVIAQNANTKVDTLKVKNLNEVTISGTKNVNRQPVTIGKVAISPMDLPQSLTVIDKDVLVRQQALDMGDVLMNVNGVYQMGNTGGVQQEIAGRGFAFSSSNTFKNGIRFNNGIKPEISSLEKVEVLKGTSAILFGNVSPGGVLNLVTKKPTFENGGSVSMRAGSYDFYKPSFDVYGAVNGSQSIAYRVNSSYEKAASFRDKVRSERMYVNPSLLIKAGKKVDILLEGDYLKDNRTLDYGTGAINYVIADVPRNQFLGAAWSYNKTEQMSGTATTTYHINNNWELRNTSGVQIYDNELFGTTRPNASNNFVKANGDWTRGVQRTGIAEEYYVTQMDLTGRFNTGSIKHNVLVGADVDKYLTTTTAYNAIAKYDEINIFDLNKFKQRSDIPEMSLNTKTTAPLNRAGVYVQDLVGITDQIKVLVGARYSYQETRSDVYTFKTGKAATTINMADAITPRAGVVYQPMKTMSLFGSFAQSFTLNTGVDVNNKALDPSITDQYEAGIKNELLDGVLTANATVYQIVSHNFAQSVLDSTKPLAKELAGEVTSRGAEIDVMTRPYHGFSVIAGYSYNQTKYTKSNTYQVGSLLRYNPQNTANLSIYYACAERCKCKGFSAGITGLYFGERVAGRSTRYLINGVEVKSDPSNYKLMPVDAYFQLDASVGYEYKGLSLRVKCSNLTDVLSYNAHDDNSVNPIAPRQFAATFAYKF
jgi:iron complex outermembrane receptor protein